MLHAGLGARGAGQPLQAREGVEGAPRRACEALRMRRVRLGALGAQHHVDVAVVGEGDLRAFKQRVQDPRRIPVPCRPQLGPEVAVERDAHAQRRRRAHCLGGRGRGGRAQRRGHPGDVQPAGPVQQRRPVVAGGRGQREGRGGAVVQHLAGPVAGAGGQEIQAHAAVDRAHRAGVHAVPAQFAQGGVAQRVVGGGAQHRHLVAEARQRDADVGLGAANPYFQRGRLQQQFAPGRRQAQQDFTETRDTTGHGVSCQRCAPEAGTGRAFCAAACLRGKVLLVLTSGVIRPARQFDQRHHTTVSRCRAYV